MVVPADAGDSGERDDAIAAQDQRQRPRLDSVLDARLQLVQRRQDGREIARAGMLVIRLVKLRRAIAQIRNFVAHGLQTLDQPGGAQRRRGPLVSGPKRRSAGRSADQGNLLRLTDDLDRQKRTPIFVGLGLRPRMPRWHAPRPSCCPARQ